MSDNNDDLDIDAKIHKAITARLARLNLDELVEKAIQTKSPAKSKEEESEVAKLTKQLEAQQKLYQEKEMKAIEKLQKQQRSQALSTLKAELKGKVIADMDEELADWLFESKKMVTVDEDGEAFFNLGDKSYPIKEGVAKFLSSKEAKKYIPAVQPTSSDKSLNMDRATSSNNSSSNMSTSNSFDSILSDLGLK